MISRAANRTSSERPSSTSLRPSINPLSFSRVRSDAGILSIGVLPSSRPVAKPDLVGFAYQAKVHPNPFSSKLRTSPNPKIERRFYRERKDEAIPMMAAVVGLILASGTTPLAYADDGKQRVTIFTPGLSGDRFVCSAVNVSEKALGITFALFDTNGALLD